MNERRTECEATHKNPNTQYGCQVKPVWFRRLLLLDLMIENCLYSRASGELSCLVCGKLYYDHPNYLPWLTLLCDGRLVHL